MTSTLYALYLSRAARANVPIGLDLGQWGLTQDSVDRRLERLPTPGSGLEILQQMQVGDHVLAASGGPQPRVKRGGWADATIDEGSLWRVTQPYHYETRRVWPAPPNRPDETYPHRFGIEEVEQLRDISKAQIELVGMDALHYSANIGGLPVPVLDGPPVLLRLDEPGPGESEDPGFLVLGGELDATALTSVRREQRTLRANLLGSAGTAVCSICGCSVPVDCLRTAHIKRRSECSEQERRDKNNIMLACTLGCDHLFELGYVTVDSDGVIRDGARSNTTTALEHAVSRLNGGSCAAHSKASEQYFAWHRERATA